jgi:hypothetical protein
MKPMGMKYKDFDSIKLNDISDSLSSLINENRAFELKRQLNLNNDKDKKEFLCDIASFANSDGGDILLGACEIEGLIGLELISIDQQILQIESIINSGINPRVSYRIKSFKMENGNHAILIRIQSTAYKPHMVVQDQYYRFYIRNEAGKTQMDYLQIKHAFLGQEMQTNRMDQYVLQRTSEIISGNEPIKLTNYPMVIFHMIPIVNFLENIPFQYNWRLYEGNSFQPFSNLTNHVNIIKRHTFNGYLLTLDNESFVEVKRNGVIEAVGTKVLCKYSNEVDNKFFAITSVEEELLVGFMRYIQLFIEIGLDFPALIYLNIYGLKDFEVPTFENSKNSINHLAFNSLLVEENEPNIPIIFKPWFDMLYQAFGRSGTTSYNSNGYFKGSKGLYQ